MSSMYITEDILDKVTTSLEMWKKLMLEVYEQDSNQMDILKKHVENYSKIEQEYDNTKNALQELDNRLSASDKCEDIDGLYAECVQNLATNSSYNKHDSRVWQAVFEGDSDVREIQTKSKKIDDSQYENIDDSLLYSNVFTPPIDPICKSVIRNPYKNRKCGHLYEFETITTYIRQIKKTQKAKCPYIGCNNNDLRIEDLIEDGELQTQITDYLNSQNTEEECDDD